MLRGFSHFVEKLIDAIASPWAFVAAVTVAVAGYLFIPTGEAREAFHLAIALVTFLLVFLLEHAEKRDTDAIHVKLNELLDAVEARREKIGVEALPGPDLARIARRERELGAPTDASEVRASRP